MYLFVRALYIGSKASLM